MERVHDLLHFGERFPVGERCKVRVVRLADFGAFAELEPGVEGLIPISEMSWGHIRSVGEVVETGGMFDCKVIRVEPKKRRIALSIKQAQADPWAGVFESYAPQSLVNGKVTRLTDFGAFVELAPGVETARSRALASVKHRTRTGGHGDDSWTEHTVEYRLWDKVAALTKLGEHLGLWKQGPADRGGVEVVVEADGSVHIITHGEA